MLAPNEVPVQIDYLDGTEEIVAVPEIPDDVLAQAQAFPRVIGAAMAARGVQRAKVRIYKFGSEEQNPWIVFQPPKRSAV